MKPNRILQLLAEGKTPIGHMIIEFGTRGIAKIAEAAGLDFVLIDMEHSGLDFGKVADLLAWFKATPVAPIVRVPAIEYHFIARVMDAGALGVMAPNVRTAGPGARGRQRHAIRPRRQSRARPRNCPQRLCDSKGP